MARRERLIEKITRAAAQPTPFDRLVREAVALWPNGTARPHHYDDALPAKLSAREYLAEALRNADRDEKFIRRLAQELGITGEDEPFLAAFRAGIYAVVRAVKYSGGCALRPPTLQLNNLIGAAPAGLDSTAAYLHACTEMALHGCRPRDVVAVEVWRAAQEAPECFGAIDEPWDAHEQRKAEREARLAALYQRIAASFTSEDTQQEVVGDLVRVTFKIAPSISAYPLATCGARLVEALAAAQD